MLKYWMVLGLGLPLYATGAAAQETELQRVLVKLGAAAVELERSLPNFTCEENVMSEEVRDGKVKRSVAFTATLRAQRNKDGRLGETFQITALNGKPFTEGDVKTPVMVSGGFDQVMRYFHPEQQGCYDYRLSPGRIDFENNDDRPAKICSERGMAGFALLNAAGEVTNIERTVPVQTAKRVRMATYATATLAPVSLGEKTYRLSNHMVAEMPMGKSTGRFEATYANCRLFKATATIGPAEMLPDEPPASKH